MTIEELAYMSNSVAAIYDDHCILSAYAIVYGSDDLKRRYLEPMTAVRVIGCFAATEPEASSDLSARSVQTVASQPGDKYVVNGARAIHLQS